MATLGLGGILADDMGLGKTVQTLAWLLWLLERQLATHSEGTPLPANLRVLVVCPKSVMANWENETARFAPSLQTARATPRRPLPDEADFLVVNYTQLRLRADDLRKQSWDAVILDEGQNIKNPGSATAKAAYSLHSRHRIVLSGTPIENRLLDLWSLFAFAQPRLLGSQTQFKHFYRDEDSPGDAQKRLAKRVRPFMLRRTKREVASDLPERTEEDMTCELEGPQRILYDAELKRARQLLFGVDNAQAFNAARFKILQSLLRLRQICCDPRLISTTLGKPSSAKLEAVLDTLEPLVAEGHRVLVLSQFVGMLELIQAELLKRDIDHLILTGKTEYRHGFVDTFQKPTGPPVFLLSLKAAGSGLNLTAAIYVVLYDPWWNPAVEAQAIDRTHRIGQTSPVIAYRLIAKGTVAEKIRTLQHRKSTMAATVMQEESLAKVMDLETLREVLS
ncbi:MAG: DEAD/DEAH box helicase [Candidatus Synoicihabitans palmerolidicus]|nr:DEAD/DEAH box helicase [Candidatus Synoicihabitans palmerolidicus]